MNFSIPYVIAINLPFWMMIVGVGAGIIVLLNWRVRGIGTIAVGLMIGGFIKFPLVTQAIQQVSELTK